NLLAEQFHRQLIAPREGVPVDMPQVVAGLIIAVILELQGTAGPLSQGSPGRAARCLPRQTQSVALAGTLALAQIVPQVFHALRYAPRRVKAPHLPYHPR